MNVVGCVRALIEAIATDLITFDSGDCYVIYIQNDWRHIASIRILLYVDDDVANIGAVLIIRLHSQSATAHCK